jgi:proton-dependent oligopeptide transporter, POT family
MNQPAAANYAANPNDRGTLMGHPVGLFLLFGVEMWERFSFYGMKAILPLYLAAALATNNAGRGWTQGQASILTGWYGGMCYLLPIIGGILADKMLGTHRSMLLGALLIALGHVTLAISGIGGMAHDATGLSIFIGGLALIAMGTGHFKPTVTVMVGQLYSENDPRRSNAFSIFYMGINVGALLGQLACSYLGEKIGWHWGFGAAAVGMLAGLGVYVGGRPAYLAGIGDAPRGASTATPYTLFIVVCALAVLFGAAYHANWVSVANESISTFVATDLGITVKWSLMIAIVGAVVAFIFAQQPGDKGPTACIFIFMLFNAFFWLAFEQSGTSLNFFAQDNTDRVVFGWEVPTGWFQMINPACIILFTPLFAWFWVSTARRNAEPSQPVKIAWGLILLGLGYVILVFAGMALKSGKVGILWLTGAYVMFTLGELFLSPTGLAFVTKAAPVRFVSLLMGVWFISSFLAHSVGGYAAALVKPIEEGKYALPWQTWALGPQSDFFLLFVLFTIGPGLLILVASPLLKKMLHGRG